MIDLITTATAKDERDRDAKIALLPVGSFEQHGDYLPLNTDTIVACAIANKIAKALPALLLPPITITCSHEHAAWRGTVSISSQTLYRIVTDVADSVRRHGVEHLVVVNGHGGNYVLSNVVQEYTAVHGPALSLFPLGSDWEQVRIDSGMESDNHSDMHGGELETSILLSVSPHLVREGHKSADSLVDETPLLLTTGMAEYTESGVIGYPSRGTAAKGEAALDLLQRRCLQRMAAISALSA
jgi:creatinine amidohydrolase